MWINTPRRLINTSSRLEVSIEHTPLPKWLLIHTVVPSALPCTSFSIEFTTKSSNGYIRFSEVEHDLDSW